jgi:hypothetical protein
MPRLLKLVLGTSAFAPYTSRELIPGCSVQTDEDFITALYGNCLNDLSRRWYMQDGIGYTVRCR